MAQIDAVIEDRFGVKSKDLSEDEWLTFYAKYRYLKEIDSKIITKSVLESVNVVFQNINNSSRK